MAKILTIGEAMGLFVGNEVGSIENVDQYTRYTAGAEMNVAIGVARLEHTAHYITKLGKDSIGKFVKRKIESEQINTENIIFDEELLTGIQFKEKKLNGDPEVINFRKNSAAKKISKNEIENIELGSFDGLHLSGVFLALSDETRIVSNHLASEAKKNDILVTFDPNLRMGLWESKDLMIKEINDLSEKCDIILPGISEGEILTGFNKAEDIADFYLAKGIKAVVVKLGEAGAYVKTVQSEGRIITGYKIDKIIDTVGAGDGFAVGIITGIVEKLSLDEAVDRGNAIGAMQLLSESDNEGLPNRKELKNFMSKDREA